MLKSYSHFLEKIRSSRRLDPLLQKQPESFFRKKEEELEAKFNKTIRSAITNALYMGYMGFENRLRADQFFTCAITLYSSRIQLDLQSMERLKQAILIRKDMESIEDHGCSSPGNITQEFSYAHPCSNGETNGVDISAFWSQQMLSCSWCIASVERCSWLSARTNAVSEEARPPNVAIKCSEGDIFEVHSSIVAQKCAKLEAAIRFERMKDGTEKTDLLVDIDIPLTKEHCLWFLQHLYHGSIVGPFPKTTKHLCHDFLVLLEFAGYYWCPSLAAECEMRLISVDPKACFCCQCSFRRQDCPLENNALVTCTYLTSGTSLCITENTVLDIIGLCSQYEDTSFACDYDIVVSVSESINQPSWMSRGGGFWTVKAGQRLREEVASKILSNFEAVVSSQLFKEHFGEDASQRESCLFLIHRALHVLASTVRSRSSSVCWTAKSRSYHNENS